MITGELDGTTQAQAKMMNLNYKLIELRPNRNLLDSNFNGYKLSLEPTPLLSLELKVPPLRCRPASDQYSFLHTELFGMHNHLERDMWNPGTIYFIASDWNIKKIVHNNDTGRLESVRDVFKLPQNDESLKGSYNPTLKFISDRLCLLSDGCGNLTLIETRNRGVEDVWMALYSCIPLTDAKMFVIKDARIDSVDNEKQISVVLLHIEHENDCFYSLVEWITFAVENDFSLEKRSQRLLKGNGCLSYIGLEPMNKALVISSNKRFKFIIDPENIAPSTSSEEISEEMSLVRLDEEYSWMQTDDEIFINFCRKEETESFNYDIFCSENILKITFKDKNVIVLELCGSIKNDLVGKTWEKGQLKLRLPKAEPIKWTELVKNGPPETYELTNPNWPTTTVEGQLEECDFNLDNEDSEYVIERFDYATNKITHKIVLGGTQPLFSLEMKADEMKFIVLRYDVDAIIWNPNLQPNAEFQLQHEGTLNAFGYIQASKMQKKYMSCSPDLSYSVICESERHVFLYKNKYETTNQLRNRSGLKSNIGQQKLIPLEKTGEVVGMIVENEFTLFLTEKYIICIQTSTPE